MNLLGLFLFVFIISNELRCSFAKQTLERPQTRSIRRIHPFWFTKNYTTLGIPRKYFRKFTANNYTALLPVGKPTTRQNLQRIPQVNFYTSIPNALGVIGQGIIWLREISAALGTPIPIWIFTIPFFILGVGLMFMPDMTQLDLPFFYPNGAGDGDPLAAFPPLPELEDLSILKQATQLTQLIPPRFIMEKLGL